MPRSSVENNMKSIRDCHVRPDLILLYAVEEKSFELLRIGSHSEIFG
ncbi:MAG: type II toxin-antitoxin system YafQ family toxin [Candidatus Accumulibacter sp.]|nr:type II toxin-antitoxin system YafQ family toxin [Accumulibacter sp.]